MMYNTITSSYISGYNNFLGFKLCTFLINVKGTIKSDRIFPNQILGYYIMKNTMVF